MRIPESGRMNASRLARQTRLFLSTDPAVRIEVDVRRIVSTTAKLDTLP
jgi:hypothetical protein